MNNKSVSFICFGISIVCLFLLILYLNNTLPTFLYNSGQYDRWGNNLVGASTVNASELNPFPSKFLFYPIFLLTYFSLIFALGFLRRSSGRAWSVIKKGFFPNLLAWGIFFLGILFSWFNWPKDTFGTIKWSLLLLIVPSIISLFLFLESEPSNVATPAEIERSKSSYGLFKNISLIIALVSFALATLLSFVSLASKEVGGVVGLVIAMIIFAAGIPIPLLLYFHFRQKLGNLQSPNPAQKTESATVIGKQTTTSFLLKLLLFFLIGAGFLVVGYILFSISK